MSRTHLLNYQYLLFPVFRLPVLPLTLFLRFLFICFLWVPPIYLLADLHLLPTFPSLLLLSTLFSFFNIIYLTALRNSLTWLFIALFLGVNPFWANLIPKKTPALDLPTSLICSTILSIKSVVFYLPMWVISSPLKKHFRITVENTASKGADISQFTSLELG